MIPSSFDRNRLEKGLVLALVLLQKKSGLLLLKSRLSKKPTNRRHLKKPQRYLEHRSRQPSSCSKSGKKQTSLR
jgi:hypothetical protein